MLRPDPSIQNIIWTNRTHNGVLPIEQYIKDNSVQSEFPSHRITGLGRHPTVVGYRNGVPFGAEQDETYRKHVEMIPYALSRAPYLTNRMGDIVPATLQVNNLASTGGAPLSIAMDDGNQLDQFMYSEHMRMHPNNPLSAAFAKRAIEAQENHIEKGPMLDSFRRELKDDEEDTATTGRKIAQGVFSRSAHASAGAPIDPTVEGWLNRTHPPTKADFENYGNKFQGSVNVLSNNMKTIHGGLNAIANNMRPVSVNTTAPPMTLKRSTSGSNILKPDPALKYKNIPYTGTSAKTAVSTPYGKSSAHAPGSLTSKASSPIKGGNPPGSPLPPIIKPRRRSLSPPAMLGKRTSKPNSFLNPKVYDLNRK